jgi:hypothetical protein
VDHDDAQLGSLTLARSLNPEIEPIYAMHAQWLSEVLGPGDSLLTPGEPVWTVENLDELETNFVGHPDLTKDKRFLEKLHDQLAPVSPAAVELMAELHVVHFLIIWNGAISAAKKRSDLEAILSWMPTPPPVPENVVAVMAPGVVHPGQWVMTRRDTQLTWLIRFSRAWKELATDRRQLLIDDPWQLKAFAVAVQAPAADSARLALLYLAHPDTFEAIVSPDHKNFIVQRFADVAGDDEDLDRRLLTARAALTPQYGEGFDWYRDPLVHRWLKNRKAWKAFLDWLQRFRAMPSFDEDERSYKLALASKVREARELAVARDDAWFEALRRAFLDRSNNLTQWQGHDSFLAWLDTDHRESLSALLALWDSDGAPVKRLQSFFDRVPTAGLGPTGQQLNIGTFLLMAEDPSSLPPMKISAFRKAWELTKWGRDADDIRPAEVYERVLVFLDELVSDSAAWEIPLRDRLDAQGAVWALVKYQENPDHWPDDVWQDFVTWRESVPVEEDGEVVDDGHADVEDLSLVDHIAAAAKDLHIDRGVLDEIVELLEDKRQVVLYGPPGTGKTFLAVRLAKAIAEGDPSRVAIVQFHPATSYEDFFEGLRPKVTDAGQVTYELTDGPLVAIAKAAASNPDRRYVLVIDEINRANLPKVFGELLFLLEYRTESVRTLYRPNEPYKLPGNLWFIGTMNTADRSAALIDAAMRRRFHFVPFFPHDGPMKGLLRRWLKDGGGRIGVAALLDGVNQELLGLVGEHLLIGPSHFMKTDLSDRALERIWTYNVFPLIEEQFWGNRDEIDRWRWAAVRQRFNQALTGSPATSVPEGDLEGGKGDGTQPT